MNAGEKKAARTRPYFLVFDGVTHVIDATSGPAAVSHLVQPRIGILRAASNEDVFDFVRGGGVVEVAGEYPEVAPSPEWPVDGAMADPANQIPPVMAGSDD
jgi:hypothetical protein